MVNFIVKTQLVMGVEKSGKKQTLDPDPEKFFTKAALVKKGIPADEIPSLVARGFLAEIDTPATKVSKKPTKAADAEPPTDSLAPANGSGTPSGGTPDAAEGNNPASAGSGEGA